MKTQWVVVINKNSCWATCYGIFHSHDAVIEWVRANQFDFEDVQAHPIEPVSPQAQATRQDQEGR